MFFQSPIFYLSSSIPHIYWKGMHLESTQTCVFLNFHISSFYLLFWMELSHICSSKLPCFYFEWNCHISLKANSISNHTNMCSKVPSFVFLWFQMDPLHALWRGIHSPMQTNKWSSIFNEQTLTPTTKIIQSVLSFFLFQMEPLHTLWNKVMHSPMQTNTCSSNFTKEIWHVSTSESLKEWSLFKLWNKSSHVTLPNFR